MDLRLSNWFRHAFAVDPPGPAAPNDLQRDTIEKLCREIVRRQLTVPALLVLETSRPLNGFSAQMLHFLQPIATAVVGSAEYEQFARFLEQRGSVDYFIERIESLEAERGTRRTSPGAAAPEHAGAGAPGRT